MSHKKYSLPKVRKDKHRVSFAIEEAAIIGCNIGINFNKEKFDLNEFALGVNVEHEHGTKFTETNITGNDPILTGKIAYEHLKEFPDYYTRLKKFEDEANVYWQNRIVNESNS